MVVKGEKWMIQDLSRIWEVCFGDSQEYIRLFMERRFFTCEPLVWLEDRQVMGVVYLLPCLIEGRKAYYGYAGGVLPQFRKRGIFENLLNYEAVGVGREDGRKEGEHMSILYNKKTVSLKKWGTFWLSDTPDEPSQGWDGACKRTATWALMKDKRSGNSFLYVNTHLDHVGKEAQKNGLALILSKISEINKDNLPVILTGDFNVRPDDPVLTELDKTMKSARATAAKTDSHDTFNGWGKGDGVIDYIYYSGFSSCPEFETIVKKYADRQFISDHFPIFAVLEF